MLQINFTSPNIGVSWRIRKKRPFMLRRMQRGLWRCRASLLEKVDDFQIIMKFSFHLISTSYRCADGYIDQGVLCAINTHIYGKGCCCSVFSTECCGNCEAGYSDDGCTCRKDAHIYAKSTYGRGAGIPLTCESDQEFDSGLCYKKCQEGWAGVAFSKRLY